METTEKPKRGRPEVPPSEKRISVSTTLPRAIAEAIKQSGINLNELIMDGLNHRQKCSRNLEKIGKLQTLLDEKTDELEAIKRDTGATT